MDFIAGEILYFNKPLTWTSFDLVNKFRYKLSRKLKVKKIKVGHAGTLDPLATGVMIVCTGRATKRIDEFLNHGAQSRLRHPAVFRCLGKMPELVYGKYIFQLLYCHLSKFYRL